MELKVTGKITKILNKQVGKSKKGTDWMKQEFLIETDDKYNNLYCFEVFGEEQVEKLNKFNKVGDTVDVKFNVKCNEWKGRYYSSLSAWSVFKAEAEETTPEAPQEADLETDDVLPF